MVSLAACVAGFILDLRFGDPAWLYHPVRLIGMWISFLEKRILRFGSRYEGKEKQKKVLLLGGALLCACVVTVSTAVPLLLLALAGRIHPFLRFGLEAFWCWQLLAATSLRKESRKVYEK